MLERRTKLRAHAAVPGRAIFSMATAEASCVVVDFSAAGACVRFAEGVSPPRLFNLHIGPDPEPCAVRVVWRRAAHVGVAFLKARAAPDVVPG
ncbi:PilZ domain-containing protein [Methylobacterium phyllosphaerae]|uniref:PilZ domain-containing protein n=1 Tax=Methylobacterium phyllosphaerae TaxID=418223 RepID=UPI000B20C051|nr:PilZ domain-containing protein [Methylobacterium phyllosphaerae]